MLFMVLSPGTLEGSGSGSAFKASQKTGQRLKVHPTDWEEPGIDRATPDLKDIGLSHTPRPLLIKGHIRCNFLNHRRHMHYNLNIMYPKSVKHSGFGLSSPSKGDYCMNKQ